MVEKSSFTLGMEAACSSETSVMIHQTIWYHIPEDSNFLVIAERVVNFAQVYGDYMQTLKDPGVTEEDHL
jgi:hypothetical protein